jgi:hypothetical protein
MSEEKSDLADVKRALEDLKPMFLAKPEPAAGAPQPKPAPPPSVQNVMYEPLEKTVPYIAVSSEPEPIGELARLQQERAQLIASGIYGPSDVLIQELDRQIALFA